ncbi:hypothetical protein K449DRAFT_438056 [Hypoxylon sp. EC38]|nr:hypothetical protein K449DRAFT_438056 [Hypoxylon sp. EC38]
MLLQIQRLHLVWLLLVFMSMLKMIVVDHSSRVSIAGTESAKKTIHAIIKWACADLRYLVLAMRKKSFEGDQAKENHSIKMIALPGFIG